MGVEEVIYAEEEGLCMSSGVELLKLFREGELVLRPPCRGGGMYDSLRASLCVLLCRASVKSSFGLLAEFARLRVVWSVGFRVSYVRPFPGCAVYGWRSRSILMPPVSSLLETSEPGAPE